MSDIFIPGMSSRFDTPRMIEDLMRIERVPRDRAANNIERIGAERVFWQDLNRRASALQESARNLFSFQNPFNSYRKAPGTFFRFKTLLTAWLFSPVMNR